MLLGPELVGRGIGALGPLGQVRGGQLDTGACGLPPPVLVLELRRQRPVEGLPAARCLLRRGHEVAVADHAVRGEIRLARQLVAPGPHLPRRGELLRGAQRAEAVQAPPARRARRAVLARALVGELLLRPLRLPGRLETLLQHVPHLHQHLDVQRRVDEPALRQRPLRPVRGRVLLRQAQAEGVLDDGAEPHPLHAQQPGGELGVEQGSGVQAQLGEARQVLPGRVQHPFPLGEERAERAGHREGERVQQRRAGRLGAQLHEIGAGAVAVARGALRVDRDRLLGRCGGGLAPLQQRLDAVDHRDEAVLGSGEVLQGRRGALRVHHRSSSSSVRGARA